MKIKILIDSMSLLSPLTGIGRYTYEISKELQLNNHLDLSFFYGYSSKSLLKFSEKKEKNRIKTLLIKSFFLKKLLKKFISISSKLSFNKYDIYWQPSFIPNTNFRTKKVITTVHDFSFILYKDFHPKERIKYYEKYFYKNIVISDVIITGSNYTKEEIIKRLNFKADKIKVVYHGINHDVFKVLKTKNLDLKVPKNFILTVGTIEPRKNLIGLLEAYSLLNNQLKSKYKLVLIGFKGWENKEIMKLINANKEHIHYLGFVSDEDLAKIYNLASCFVYPSFYEGFGLPLLEAMACGLPVVCSDTSSLPEVGGDAVEYCNPNDKESIMKKIELVLTDERLKDKMIQKGLTRASKFSWEKSANEHMKIFKDTLNEV